MNNANFLKMIVVLIVGFSGLSLFLRHASVSQKMLPRLAALQSDLERKSLSYDALVAYSNLDKIQESGAKSKQGSRRRMTARVKREEQALRLQLEQEEQKKQLAFNRSYENLLAQESRLYDAFIEAGKTAFFKGVTYSLEQLREYARLHEKDLALFEQTLNKGQRKIFADFQKIQTMKVAKVLDAGMLMNDQLSLLRDIRQNLAYQRVIEFDKELARRGDA